MESKLIWANLVSTDLEKTTKFYKTLGFQQNGEGEAGEGVSFFFGQKNFVINFFTRERLSEKVNGNLTDPKKENEVMFSLSAATRDEVDQWVEKVKEAGGTVFSNPQAYQKGYTFAFADPDNHRFNVLYWPGM
jgi:predicted lactoylglutathione lyase